MLSALNLAVAAGVSTTATNDMFRSKTLRQTLVEVEAVVTLPMASTAVLMNAVRNHTSVAVYHSLV